MIGECECLFLSRCKRVGESDSIELGRAGPVSVSIERGK